MTVPKIGVRWQPLDRTLTVRSTFSEGFREPSLYELYSPARLSLRDDPICTQAAIISTELAPLPDYLQPAVEAFVLKLLSKDPDARPKSAHAALAELAAAAQDRKQRGSRSSSGVFGRIFGGKKSNDSVPPQTAEGGPRVELSGLVRAALRG